MTRPHRNSPLFPSPPLSQPQPRVFPPPTLSECRPCPAGRTAVSGECASPSTCQLGQVGHIEVLFGPTRCAMPRQDRRALHAAPESRTPIVQRGQVPRQSLHISPAPPALPRTTGSAARLRVPTPTLHPPAIRWRSISFRPPGSFALRPLALPPGPCALRFPACAAPPRRPARHTRRCMRARAPIPRTLPAKSSVVTGPPRLSPSVGPSCAHRIPAAADPPTTPRLRPF